MTDATYVWFLEPRDKEINKTISECCEPEDFKKVRCADGKEHPLWRCTELVRDCFANSRAKLGTRFRVWRQKDNGKIEDVDFIFQKKVKKTRLAHSSKATA